VSSPPQPASRSRGGQRSPAQLEAAADALVAQAVAQGLPPVITDPGVMTRLAEILRQAQERDKPGLSGPP